MPRGVGPRLEIVSRRRFRGVGPWLVLVALATGAGYWLFEHDAVRALALSATKAQGTRGAGTDVAALEAQNEELRRRVIVLERKRQIERKAYGDVEEHLRTVQGQLASLREQVAFYQAIVSTAETKSLNIQTLVIEREGQGSGWLFQVVLTRNTKSDNILSGSVRLDVFGRLDGEDRRFSLADLSDGDRRTLDFQFRYFQRIEGRLTLPAGFEPEGVVVEAGTDGIGSPRVERAFDWPENVG